MSMYATWQNHMSNNVMIMDVNSAFIYGNARRDIYIELPPEDKMSKHSNLMAKLNKAMYGTRDAPQIWQEVVEERMHELGFKVSVLHPSVYLHAVNHICVLAHVDDFFALELNRTCCGCTPS